MIEPASPILTSAITTVFLGLSKTGVQGVVERYAPIARDRLAYIETLFIPLVPGMSEADAVDYAKGIKTVMDTLAEVEEAKKRGTLNRECLGSLAYVEARIRALDKSANMIRVDQGTRSQ